MNKKFFKDVVLIILFCILLCIGLVRIDDILALLGGILNLLSPVFIGILLAFLLNTPYRFIYRKFSLIKPPRVEIRLFKSKKKSDDTRHRKGGWVASAMALICTYLIFFAVVTLIAVFVIPQISSSVQQIANNAENYLQSLFGYIEDIRHRFFDGGDIIPFVDLDLDRLSQVFNDLLGDVVGYAENVTAQVIAFTSQIISGAFNFIMGLIFSIYFILGKEKIKSGSKKFFDAFVPKKVSAAIEKGVHLTGDVLASYLVKQVVEGLIVGLVCFTVMSITGFDYPVLIAVVLGLLCMVPVFGPVAGVMVSSFLILLISPSVAWLYMLAFIAIIFVTYKLFMPKLYKSDFKLHPLLVLFSVVAGGYTFGFWGIFLSIPCMTVVTVLLNEYVRRREEGDVKPVKQITKEE